MVLDTRLKSFKYSWFTKLLCIVFACVCAVSAVLSFIPLFYRWIITDGEMNFTENVTIYDTTSFVNYVRSDINIMIGLARKNEFEARYQAEKKACIESMIAQFKAEKEAQGKQVYDYGDYTEVYYRDTVTLTHESPVLGTVAYSFALSLNPESVADSVAYQFESDYRSSFIGHFNASQLDLLKNVRYYAETKDGTVISNVDSKDSVINEAFKEYVHIVDGNIMCSENIKNSAFMATTPANYFSSSAEVYYSINPSFVGNDKFSKLQNTVNLTNNIDYAAKIITLIVSVIGMILFLTLSVTLAGHKGDELRLSFVDKVPCDLHLALSVFADFWVGFAAVGLAFLRHEQVLWEYEADFWLEEIVAHQKLFIIILSAVVTAFVLILAELLTSFARRIKTKSTIFKHTLIFYIIVAVLKLLGFIGRQIAKLFRKIKGWFRVIIFRPQKLNKGVAILAVVGTVASVFALLLCGFLLCLSIYDATEFALFLVCLVILAVLAADAYALYRVFRYMRSLDSIIVSAENHEPFDMKLNEVPESLIPLVKAYDETNSELQKAILKAVKDERTKTELITNVSHDLKTPLTSVINYIDLLKQCDITDEKALEYMGVIDEKSIKLKRLIEDLIEASKVSSGNVTINKTKLNLNELVTQAIVEETAELEKQGLRLVFDEPEQKVIVNADGTKIYRVIENLLSNVSKYSAPNSRVYAGVYSKGNYGYFEIKNISNEPLNISAEELTERFVRGDASRNRDGNGLGLSIAKDLCTLNDGELIIAIDGDLFKATVKIPK